MKQVRAHIDQRAAEFRRRPLFAFLHDSTIPARRRLTFVPFLTHFVMSFADLYRFFFVATDQRDRFDELSNTHLSEDAGHWKWFLADLDAIDFDPSLRFTDAVRFVWSDSTVKTRVLTYRICQLSAGLSSFEKLTLIRCIEVTGGVALEAVAVPGRQYQTESGRKLVYVGSHHIETEGDHTLEAPDVVREIESRVLTDAERARHLAVVDQAFEAFREFVDEMFDLARTEKGLPARARE